MESLGHYADPGGLPFAAPAVLVGIGFGVNPWFGFLHAVGGTVSTAGFTWLMIDRFRHPLSTKARA